MQQLRIQTPRLAAGFAAFLLVGGGLGLALSVALSGPPRGPFIERATAPRYLPPEIVATERDVGWLVEPGVERSAVRGRLVDEDERPMAGTRVILSSVIHDLAGLDSPETTTDADGRFAFEGLSPAPYRLVAHAFDRVYALPAVDLRSPIHRRRGELHLEARSRCNDWLEGRAVDSQGGLLRDARIHFIGRHADLLFPFHETTSVPTRGGEFRLCRDDLKHWPGLMIDAPGRAQVNIAELAGGDVVLPPGGSLEGTILAADGTPVSGAKVTLFNLQWNGFGNMLRHTSTDGDGRYRFDNLLAVSYQLGADHGSHVFPGLLTLPAVAPGEVRHIAPYAMGACDLRLAGTVVENGEPVAGASINIGGVTQGDGSFVSRCLPDGLRGSELDYWGTQIDVPRFGRLDDLLIEANDVPDSRPELAPYVRTVPELVVRTTGQVVEADGRPVSGARVMVHNGEGEFAAAFSNGLGEFDMPAPAGELTYGISLSSGVHVDAQTATQPAGPGVRVVIHR